MPEIASSYNNWHYNPRLKKYALENRNTLNKSATCMWKYALRKGMMHGYTFKRERPILNFIVDFVCLDLLLVIEVDGITHASIEQISKDEIRDGKLREIGFSVLRFSSENVLNNMEVVNQDISDFIKKIVKGA